MATTNRNANTIFDKIPLMEQDDKDAMARGTVSVFDVTITVAELNAGTAVIVPALTGKQFVPTNAWMQSPGHNVTTATLVRLIEETSSNVVMSHAIADLDSSAWATKAGGTVVVTYLEKALAAGKAILADKTGSTAAGADDGLRFVVTGFYI